MKEIEKINNNFLFITYSYLKKLFNWKNILFFIFMFALFYILEFQLEEISNYVNGEERFIDHVWRVRSCIFGSYLIFIIDYVYIYLKKNNFNQINKTKNSFSNILITFIIFIILWTVLFIPIYTERETIKLYDAYQYKVILFMFFIMLSFNLITLFVLSLISENIKNNNKNKSNFHYIFLVSIIVLSLTLWLWLEELFGLSNEETLNNFKLILEIFTILNITLLIMNILERIILRRVRK